MLKGQTQSLLQQKKLLLKMNLNYSEKSHSNFTLHLQHIRSILQTGNQPFNWTLMEKRDFLGPRVIANIIPTDSQLVYVTSIKIHEAMVIFFSRMSYLSYYHGET